MVVRNLISTVPAARQEQEKKETKGDGERKNL